MQILNDSVKEVLPFTNAKEKIQKYPIFVVTVFSKKKLIQSSVDSCFPWSFLKLFSIYCKQVLLKFDGIFCIFYAETKY